VVVVVVAAVAVVVVAGLVVAGLVVVVVVVAAVTVVVAAAPLVAEAAATVAAGCPLVAEAAAAVAAGCPLVAAAECALVAVAELHCRAAAGVVPGWGRAAAVRALASPQAEVRGPPVATGAKRKYGIVTPTPVMGRQPTVGVDDRASSSPSARSVRWTAHPRGAKGGTAPPPPVC
jgi:hypothetical protein